MGADEVNQFLTEVRVNDRPTSSATARKHHRVWTDVTGMPGVGEENVILDWKILDGSLKILSATETRQGTKLECYHLGEAEETWTPSSSIP